MKTFGGSVIYSYLTALGIQELNDSNESYHYFIYLFSTLLNLVVMLNLLIAIISDTYARVASTQEEFAFKEKCGVISDCRDFPFFRLWAKERKPCSFLFVAMSEELSVSKRSKIIDSYDLYDQN